jgi:hypothetical protein
MIDGKEESSPPAQAEKPKTYFSFLKLKNPVKILKVEKYVQILNTEVSLLINPNVKDFYKRNHINTERLKTS